MASVAIAIEHAVIEILEIDISITVGYREERTVGKLGIG